MTNYLGVGPMMFSTREKVDPVKLAYDHLKAALRVLGDNDEAYDHIASVMDQLCGWDCCSQFRLVAPAPDTVVPYREDL